MYFKHIRKKCVVIAGALLLIVESSAVAAEEFPNKPVEVVTHTAAGSGTDVTTRMMMLHVHRELGQDMVVVNKKGSNGAAALEYYGSLPADGYTILTLTTGHAVVMAKGKVSMNIDDLHPLARATNDPQILMTKCGVYTDAEDFIAKQKDAPITYGVTQVGSIDDVSAFMFAKKGGLRTPKMLPFDGSVELVTQLVAGAIDAGVLNLIEASSQIEAGEICPTVVLADERMAKLENTPTAKELGIPVSFSIVRGYAVHKDTPKKIVRKLEKTLIKSMNQSVYQGFLVSVGLDSSSVAGSDVWGPQIQETINEMEIALKELGFIE